MTTTTPATTVPTNPATTAPHSHPRSVEAARSIMAAPLPFSRRAAEHVPSPRGGIVTISGSPVRPTRAGEAERIGAQLARVAATVPWGRVQDDLWDARSGFVYRLRAEASVRDRAERVAAEHGLDRREFVHYALRRWYCFWARGSPSYSSSSTMVCGPARRGTTRSTSRSTACRST